MQILVCVAIFLTYNCEQKTKKKNTGGLDVIKFLKLYQ